MLFNSYEFILLFLPLTLAGFYALRARGRHGGALWWLAGASLVFYGWWSLRDLGIMLCSIVLNFAVAEALVSLPAGRRRRALLAVALCGNLALIGWFKYAGFLAESIGELTGAPLPVLRTVLPLGISFFTFQKIAYLVDTARRPVRRSFRDYLLFVTFFPQLIAGPIVHHAEVMPQFSALPRRSALWRDLAVGLSLFAAGLFKKVVIADGVSGYAVPVFDAAHRGAAVGFVPAWAGALAYTFQLYFDFSGYSDMALGLGRLVGIRLPVNFNSPYKATSIIDFWRRWHITLSRFLRDYLYIPLGGNRNGSARRYLNVFVTMLLGGLWHGAGWTYVAWGALHGGYLVANHLWRDRLAGRLPSGLRRVAGWAAAPLTLMAIVAAWVVFRAADLPTAGRLLRGMVGLSGVALPALHRLGPVGDALRRLGITAVPDSQQSTFLPGWGGAREVAVLATLTLLTLAAPNTQQIFRRWRPAWERVAAAGPSLAGRVAWRPTYAWALLTLVALLWSLSRLGRVQEFLYFQF